RLPKPRRAAAFTGPYRPAARCGARHIDRRDERARGRGPLKDVRRCSARSLTSRFISTGSQLQGFGPMRTDELIYTLVADHAAQRGPKPVGHGLVMAIIGGLAISYALFSLTLGVRPDFISALGTWRYDMKLGVNLVLMIAATCVARRLSTPTPTPPTAMT